MKIQFLGSAQEVGRSCILINDSFLLDAGIKIGPEESEYPLDFSEKDVKAVFLSHAHLDHTGALPLLNHLGLKCPIYATKMTKQITKILLHDSIHIEKLSKNPAYSEENINNILSYFQFVEYNKEYEEKGDGFSAKKEKKVGGKNGLGNSRIKFRLFDAGHIPGSGSFLLKINDNGKDKTLLYTGDINSISTYLLDGLTYDQQIAEENAKHKSKTGKLKTDNLKNVKLKIDVMICESTYGGRNHPSREAQEKEFLDIVERTVDNKGSVLIPAFSVGRAQEVLIMLSKRRFDAPIFLDGMAKKVTNILLDFPAYVKDVKLLKKAISNIEFVRDFNHRQMIVKNKGIFVTTAGMLDGGPVMNYLKYVYNDEKSAILLTGYQAEGSNGRMILEQKKVIVDNRMLNVKCFVQKFDFSAHCGQKELLQMLKNINPTHLIINHGDVEEMNALAEKAAFIENIHIPVDGETIRC
ncbi:MBL fold metallo-hydrolase [Candidatus Woesearchaeota archaeon]|nr:MBL fold metallo-hydrolase [Candidatus Woesearchaeota archaeon]